MQKKINIPLWKLRRLGPRAVQILARHKGKSVALGHLEAPLGAAVQKYVELYDATRTMGVSTFTNPQGAQAIEGLRLSVRRWLGTVARDIPGFDVASFADRNTTADDSIGNAERFLEVCRTFHTGEGGTLPYKEALEQELGAAVAAARTAWLDEQAKRARRQTLQDDTRKAGKVLQKELVALRRTLRVDIGPSHIDFLRLKTFRGLHEDVEEVVDGPVVAEPVVTAPAVAAPVVPIVAPPLQNGSGASVNVQMA